MVMGNINDLLLVDSNEKEQYTDKIKSQSITGHEDAVKLLNTAFSRKRV